MSQFTVVLDSALAVAGSYSSDPIFVGDKTNFGMGIAPIGTFTGEIYLEGSNDKEGTDSVPNWFLITDSFQSFADEEVYYDVSNFGYSFVRVRISIISGSITSGKIDMFLKRI
jgi:hypothetical protein